jgi:hypothetical protein
MEKDKKLEVRVLLDKIDDLLREIKIATLNIQETKSEIELLLTNKDEF